MKNVYSRAEPVKHDQAGFIDMPKNYCIMQIWAESGKTALPIVTIHKSYISF